MKENILKSAIKIISERKLIESDKGYNLFTILGMERKEVTAHSAFIYSLLDKDGAHNKGEFFLRKFIKTVMNIEIDNEQTVHAEREMYSLYGRIDFVVIIDGKEYAIEMKIDAGEQPDQLQRYYELTNNNVYFLTLDRRKAKSCDEKIKEHIIRISFKDEINKWLCECIEELDNSETNLKAIIYQYINLIKKISAEYKGDMKLMSLIKGKDSFLAINELTEAQNQFKTLFLKQFFYRLEKELDFSKYCDLPIIEDEECNNYYNGKTFPQIYYRFKVINDKINLNNMHFLYYFIEINSCLCSYVSIRDKDGYILDVMPKKYVKIQKFFEDFPDYNKLKDDFRSNIYWNSILCDGKLVDFKYENDGYLSLMAQDNNEEKLFSETKLRQVIKAIESDFNKAVDKLKDFF